MKKTIQLSGRPVSFVLKRFSRSKSVRFSVSSERVLLVTAPKWVPFYFIEKALESKKEWVFRTLAELPTAEKYSYRTHKESARTLVEERLDYWNRQYGFSYGRVSIRDQKTRWGSCSKKGNLNFSYKLAVIPPHLTDYVIVHELCHLQEFNHSKAFWDLVERAMPDYRAHRKALREWK